MKRETRNLKTSAPSALCFRVSCFMFLVSSFLFLSDARAHEKSPTFVQDTDELRDITGIEEVPPAPATPLWPYGLALACFLTGSLFLVGWKYLRKTQPSVEPPPEQWALAELDRIESQNLPEAGQVECYHTLTSGVIRTYLESRFHLPASRQTTPEFLQTMRASPLLPGPQQDVLRDFLEQCDLAKFARVLYSPQECRAVGQIARRLVQETSARENNQPRAEAGIRSQESQGSGIKGQESGI